MTGARKETPETQETQALSARAAWSIAARNLWRAKRRTVVTGLAVALGVAGLSLATGYVYRVKNYMTVWSIYQNKTGHVAVYKRNGLEKSLVRPREYTLSQSDFEFIERESRALAPTEFVAPFLLGTGLAGNGCKTLPFSAYGMTPAFEKWMRSHPAVLKWTPELAPVKYGVALSAGGREDGVVLGQGLFQLLTKDLGIFEGKKIVPFVADCTKPEETDKLRFDANIQLAASTFTGQFGVVDADVVGAFSSGYADVDSSVLSAPLSLLQSLYGTTNLTYTAVYLKDPADAERVAAELVRRGEEQGRPIETYVYDDKRVAPVLVGTVTFLYTLGGAIAVVLCGLASLTILNTMTIAVTERTREMGMLRALGFRKRDLRSLFVKEAVVVVCAGAMLGILIALAAASLINALNLRFKPPGVADTMQFLIVLSPTILATIAVVLAGLGALSTRIAVRRKVNETVATLLASSGA